MKDILNVSILCLIARIQSFAAAGGEAKYRIPGMMNESVDPLYWPEFSSQFDGNFLRGKMVAKDVNLSGWSTLRILDVRANVTDPKRVVTEVDWWVNKIFGKGRFELNGKIGHYTFQGAGPFTVTLGKMSGTWRIAGSREKTDPYMEIVSFGGTPEINSFALTADNAANGNERLGQLVVATINRTWRIMVQLANGRAEREWGDFWKEKLNKVFLSVPYDELFPLENNYRSL